MSRVPSWVVLVAMFPAIGVVLAMLGWAIRAIVPNVGESAVSLIVFFLGMVMGGVGMPWWMFWSQERKVRR